MDGRDRDQYTHDLVDATAQSLEDFANNVRKMVLLERGERTSFMVEYEKVNGEQSQVLVFIFRDEDGDYYFNEALIGDINSALEFYAMACAPLIKEVALDEHGADSLEDVCRDFIHDEFERALGEEPAPAESSHVIDLTDGIFSVSDVSESMTSDEDEEIVEVYPAGSSLPSEGVVA